MIPIFSGGVDICDAAGYAVDGRCPIQEAQVWRISVSLSKYSQVFVHFFVWCRISAINRTNDTVSLMNTHLLLKNVSNNMSLF